MASEMRLFRNLSKCVKMDITLGNGLGEFLLESVEVVDVGGVVLLMVELHDLRGDDRLECVVVVRQVGQGVLRARGTEI